MRAIFAITRKELEQYFASPLAYALVALFMVLTGIFFFIYLQFYVQQSTAAMQMGRENAEVTQSIMRPFFANAVFFLIFFLPALTMRQFAEEKKQGTYELLMTSPLTVPQIITGKFFGLLSVLLLQLLLFAIYPGILYIYGNPDAGPILAGMLGMFLMGIAFLASGIFFSSLTENQLIALLTGIVFFLVMWIISWLTRSEAWYGKLAQYVSIYERFDEFTQGIINLKDAFYCVTFALFFLFTTGIVLQSQRWKS